MIVPQYWAEAKRRERTRERGQITLRRFGWSNDSPADARQMAEARVEEALAQWHRGANVRPAEPRVPYNGAEGIPIREEIIERDGDTVITRNAYGALCLNTPRVLFADIDLDHKPPAWLRFISWYLMFVTGCVWAFLSGSWLPLIVGLVVSLILYSEIAQHFHQMIERKRGGTRRRALEKVRQFITQNPSWLIRVYRTPNGFRLLAMHDVFDPRSALTEQFFSAVGVDPLYARMCHHQHCFRARVSPKPWRIGLDQHLTPRPGVWPIKPDRLPDRQRWVRRYEGMAEGFAACCYETTLGEGQADPQAEQIRAVHDRLCRADSGLPIA